MLVNTLTNETLLPYVTINVK